MVSIRHMYFAVLQSMQELCTTDSILSHALTAQSSAAQQHSRTQHGTACHSTAWDAVLQHSMAQHSADSTAGTCDSKDGAASNCCSAYLEVPGPVALLSWLCFFYFRRLQPPKSQVSDKYLSCLMSLQEDCRRIACDITKIT